MGKRFTGYAGYTVEDSICKYEETPQGTKDRPNVVYIVLDDLGFAHLGCYGSNIHTPNIDRLAEEGLRYNNFHTTAICSATRASLLTGMDHHTAGIGAVVEFMNGFENGEGHLKADCATAAEILKEYGYGTYAAGKWHLADQAETTEAGPYDHWPLAKGFDRYYGCLHAQTDQYFPQLVNDNTVVVPPKTLEEGYHFSEDITDHAIKYIFHQKAAYPEKPFFLYLAYGAMHTPHHAPKEYIDKYRGKFDEGWDVMREKWFARQKEIGVIPQEAELTPRNQYVQPWDELSDKEKKVFARYMEAYAGMLEHTDAQIGRLVEYLRESGELDHTVIVLISDNGASAEGRNTGLFNSYGDAFDTEEENIDYAYAHLDEIGTPKAFSHYPIGWANAGNTPFPWYKMWTYSGGVKDPMIIRYPQLISDPGAVRTQYHHVSDITPTILDIIGAEKPEYIKGVKQKPFSGISFKYTLQDGKAKDRKTVQYYEMIGNRAIYKDGWKAIVNHFENASGGKFEDDKWELYHVAEDYSECYDVAYQYPEKVKELERVWFIEAAKAGVFPMLNGVAYGAPAERAKLYTNIRKNDRFEVYKNVIEPVEIVRTLNTDLNTKSHIVRAQISRTDRAQQGVILSAGSYRGGFSFYILDNRLKYVYSRSGVIYYTAISDIEVPVGDVTVEYRAKALKDRRIRVQLLIDGKQTAETIVERTNMILDFTASVGANKKSTIVPQDYEVPFAFEGKLKEVAVWVEGHVVNPSEELELFFQVD